MRSRLFEAGTDPPGRPTVAVDVDDVRARRDRGETSASIAMELGVSAETGRRRVVVTFVADGITVVRATDANWSPARHTTSVLHACATLPACWCSMSAALPEPFCAVGNEPIGSGRTLLLSAELSGDQIRTSPVGAGCTWLETLTTPMAQHAGRSRGPLSRQEPVLTDGKPLDERGGSITAIPTR